MMNNSFLTLYGFRLPLPVIILYSDGRSRKNLFG